MILPGWSRQSGTWACSSWPSSTSTSSPFSTSGQPRSRIMDGPKHSQPLSQHTPSLVRQAFNDSCFDHTLSLGVRLVWFQFPMHFFQDKEDSHPRLNPNKRPSDRPPPPSPSNLITMTTTRWQPGWGTQITSSETSRLSTPLERVCRVSQKETLFKKFSLNEYIPGIFPG